MEDVQQQQQQQRQVEEESELSNAKRELQLWRSKVEVEEDVKARLTLKKLEEEQQKRKINKQMMDLNARQDGRHREASQSSRALQEQMKEVRRRKMELTEKLKKTKALLQQKKMETERLQHKFKICAELPDREVEFAKPNDKDDDDVTGDEPIRGQFSVCQEGALQLRAGQALITFEEERVVSQLLQGGRCSVSFEDHSLEVTPKRIRTEPLVQFELRLVVSRRELDVAEVASSMPVERVAERLELAFCRPSVGGAEVRGVAFDPRQGTARVHFLKPGVAEWLALRGEHAVDLGFPAVVKVAPVYEAQLHKFQSFCGAPKRTLLVDDITDPGDEEEVQDQLEIHFQKPSNGGGEIEHMLYTGTGRLAFLTSDL